ncbi:MAG TPA: hypothetical protein VK756_09825 [Solirubrobacteraceae bacterium]|jgi:hypothetical protein|nr:hypothetical protein [Solirubrobacteraceae bacterium]
MRGGVAGARRVASASSRLQSRGEQANVVRLRGVAQGTDELVGQLERTLFRASAVIGRR